MKKIVIVSSVILMVLMTIRADAQFRYHGGWGRGRFYNGIRGYGSYRPYFRGYSTFGLGLYFNPFAYSYGYPYYNYPGYGYPYSPYNYGNPGYDEAPAPYNKNQAPDYPDSSASAPPNDYRPKDDLIK